MRAHKGEITSYYYLTDAAIQIKNYVHSFVAETSYIYRERNIFRLCYCFPGLLMMGVTRQMAFMKLILKAIIERRLQRVKKIF